MLGISFQGVIAMLLMLGPCTVLGRFPNQEALCQLEVYLYSTVGGKLGVSCDADFFFRTGQQWKDITCSL